MNTDRFTVRAVVILLGALANIGLLGIIWLVDRGAPSADLAIVSTLAGAASGALGAVLVSTRSGGGEPAQDVNVVNAPSDPVPVEPANH